MSLPVWQPRGYQGVISARSLFSEPLSRNTFDPYFVDDLHSAMIQLLNKQIWTQNGQAILVSDFVAALHPYEVEKPDGY